MAHGAVSPIKPPVFHLGDLLTMAGMAMGVAMGDSWSSWAAGQGWELHRAFLALEKNSVDAAAELDQPVADAYPRCLPRVDHQVARKQFA